MTHLKSVLRCAPLTPYKPTSTLPAIRRSRVKNEGALPPIFRSRFSSKPSGAPCFRSFVPHVVLLHAPKHIARSTSNHTPTGSIQLLICIRTIKACCHETPYATFYVYTSDTHQYKRFTWISSYAYQLTTLTTPHSICPHFVPHAIPFTFIDVLHITTYMHTTIRVVTHPPHTTDVAPSAQCPWTHGTTFIPVPTTTLWHFLPFSYLSKPCQIAVVCTALNTFFHTNNPVLCYWYDLVRHRGIHTCWRP